VRANFEPDPQCAFANCYLGGKQVPVYFSEIRIANYRSCIATSLQLTPFTALVGRNNCGKSNCLNALQWLVRKGKLAAEDFYDRAQPVVVVAELVGITSADLDSLGATHRSRIAPHVQEQKLRIRRTQAEPGVDSEWTIFDHTTNAWIANPGGIDNAIVKLFPEPIRIGAMEDAEEDVSKSKTSTTIGKLLAAILANIQERHEPELAPHFSAILRKIGADGAERLESLDSVDDSINGKIAELFPGIHIKLDFPVPGFKDLIKDGTVKVYEDNGPGRAFGKYGHGAQRAVQMAMVRHLADLKRGEAVVGGATLLLVDEPELFMHPFAVEQVREALRSLSQAGYQVVFSTHSAQMILAKDARNALLLKKGANAGTKVRPRIEDLVRRIVEEPTHQALHLFSLTNASQVLFSDHVVLTEGKTELRLLPTIYRILAGRTLGQASTALVSVGGISNLRKTMSILEALGLPSRAVVDLDYALTGAVSHGFLGHDDPDVLGCRAVFQRLADEGRVTLNSETGLPTKKQAVVSPPEAYELLAADAVGAGHIGLLVPRLRAQKVWLWSKGAIEAHVGLKEKNESAWVALQARLENEPLDQVCNDPESVQELVAWLEEGPPEIAIEA